jgi:hypothetical protein
MKTMNQICQIEFMWIKTIILSLIGNKCVSYWG